MVQTGPHFAGAGADADGGIVEVVIAGDGDAALALLRRERFDSLVVDLALAALDGWCLLAAVGHRPDRPRLIVIVRDRSEIDRARNLGADLCVTAGTQVHVRALTRSTKEMTWPPRPLPSSSPRPTTSGVHA
jgi:DNA-binding response OmpR family regulator